MEHHILGWKCGVQVIAALAVSLSQEPRTDHSRYKFSSLGSSKVVYRGALALLPRKKILDECHGATDASGVYRYYLVPEVPGLFPAQREKTGSWFWSCWWFGESWEPVSQPFDASEWGACNVLEPQSRIVGTKNHLTRPNPTAHAWDRLVSQWFPGQNLFFFSVHNR